MQLEVPHCSYGETEAQREEVFAFFFPPRLHCTGASKVRLNLGPGSLLSSPSGTCVCLCVCLEGEWRGAGENGCTSHAESSTDPPFKEAGWG